MSFAKFIVGCKENGTDTKTADEKLAAEPRDVTPISTAPSVTVGSNRKWGLRNDAVHYTNKTEA